MSKGRGFESQHRILDRHFCKIVMKINEKEAEDGPFKKKNSLCWRPPVDSSMPSVMRPRFESLA